jgi:hypothetical protein
VIPEDVRSLQPGEAVHHRDPLQPGHPCLPFLVSELLEPGRARALKSTGPQGYRAAWITPDNCRNWHRAMDCQRPRMP